MITLLVSAKHSNIIVFETNNFIIVFKLVDCSGFITTDHFGKIGPFSFGLQKEANKVLHFDVLIRKSWC
jgi:hypothetical protein